MNRSVLGLASGVVVLILGVIAVATLLRTDQAAVAEATSPPTSPQVTVVDSAPAVESTTATVELPGVPEEISRILEWSGDATFADADELAQVPPTVVEVLEAYGVPLRIPVSGAGG